MGLSKVATTVMTRQGQSSRWSLRAHVKFGARKRRRREDRRAEAA